MHARVPRGPTNGRDSVHGCVRGGRFLGHLHWAGDEFDTGNGQMMCLLATYGARTRPRAHDRARARPRARESARPCFRRLRAGRGSRWADGLGRTHSERAVASSLGADHGELRLQARPPLACGGGVAENFAAIQGGGGGGCRARAGLGSSTFFLTGGWVGVARPRSSRGNGWARQRSRMCSRWQIFGPPALGSS